MKLVALISALLLSGCAAKRPATFSASFSQTTEPTPGIVQLHVNETATLPYIVTCPSFFHHAILDLQVDPLIVDVLAVRADCDPTGSTNGGDHWFRDGWTWYNSTKVVLNCVGGTETRFWLDVKAKQIGRAPTVWIKSVTDGHSVQCSLQASEALVN